MKEKIEHIVDWITDYAEQNNKTSLVVGVSGGIDSSVVSTLCAKTGLRTIPIVMTIKNKDMLALEHAWWLEEKFSNVSKRVINLEKIFHEFENASKYLGADSEHAFANSRSRLRMMMLYQVATSNNGLVVGTGNKVEDFGVGFYTKYGDGGVDISPIADCMKTDVWKLAGHLHILQDIQDASPSDGLWDDGRTDEDQIGMSYFDLEKCMKQDEMGTIVTVKKDLQKLETYKKIRQQNMHKMKPIPVCDMEKFR
jgi:NAD+ synthase